MLIGRVSDPPVLPIEVLVDVLVEAPALSPVTAALVGYAAPLKPKLDDPEPEN